MTIPGERNQPLLCQACFWEPHARQHETPATQKATFPGGKYWYLCDRHVNELRSPARIEPIYSDDPVLGSLEPDALA